MRWPSEEAESMTTRAPALTYVTHDGRRIALTRLGAINTVNSAASVLDAIRVNPTAFLGKDTDLTREDLTGAATVLAEISITLKELGQDGYEQACARLQWARDAAAIAKSEEAASKR